MPTRRPTRVKNVQDDFFHSDCQPCQQPEKPIVNEHETWTKWFWSFFYEQEKTKPIKPADQ
jgi:hypothetical protein